MVQVQTDPHLMPIEDATVKWPERLSPYVPVARLRLPAQRFDSDEQLAFADVLRYNPWHSLPEHRPLGNSNRARRRMYAELAAAAPADEPGRARRADRRRVVPRQPGPGSAVCQGPRTRLRQRRARMSSIDSLFRGEHFG